MAMKCPKCGGELAQTTPEIAKCKGCGAAFKRKGALAKNGDKNSAKKQGKRKEMLWTNFETTKQLSLFK